jgi:hypothetical protein
MAMFGLPGGAEGLIIGGVLLFYALIAVGFFTLVYFAIAKGVARGIRDGFSSIPAARDMAVPSASEPPAAVHQADPPDSGEH